MGWGLAWKGVQFRFMQEDIHCALLVKAFTLCYNYSIIENLMSYWMFYAPRNR